MKIILFVLLYLIPNICHNQVFQATMVDNEFVPHIQEFKLIVDNHKYDKKIENLGIIFADIPPEKGTQVLAYCATMFTDYPFIYVDRKTYLSATPMSQQFTLLHELGHCICDRFHTSASRGVTGLWEKLLYALGLAKEKGVLEDGCPSSLMYPYEFSESCMMRHYFYYIEEFKQGCQ